MTRLQLLTIGQTLEAAIKVISQGQRGAVSASVVEVHSLAVLVAQLAEIASTSAALCRAADLAQSASDCDAVTSIEIKLRDLLSAGGFLSAQSSELGAN